MSVVTESCRRVGDFIESNDGRPLWPLDVRVEDLDIHDMATALSRINRYTGRGAFPWSVASHSYWVAALCPPEHKLWALAHDLPEAFLGDVSGPIKRSRVFDLYREAEADVMAVICDWLGIDHEMPEVVDRADKAMLWHEANALMKKPLAPWWDKWKPYADHFGDSVEVRVQPAEPFMARNAFLAYFHRLTDGRFA